jgi:Skp family chaperone for outer membrane proteins
MKFQNLGWVLAAGLGATMLAGGFQTQTTKVGVVNVQTVFQSSDLFLQRQDDLKAMQRARADLLDYIHTYPTVTTEQANRLKTLSIKTDLTPAEKAELTKLRNDVQTTAQAFNTLQQKPSPTPDEVAKLNAFNDQARKTDDLLQDWKQQFGAELTDQQDKYQVEVLDKVAASVQDYAKKQGYTLIFANNMAPFGTNDVTAETLKVMNAKK